MYTKQEMHERLINLIKSYDYTFMYSEDNGVWEIAKQQRQDIKFHILSLINIHHCSKDQLLKECLSLFDENHWEGLAHKEIKSFFNL